MSLPRWIVLSALVGLVALNGAVTAQIPADNNRVALATPDLGNHPLTPDEKGGTAETGPYEVVLNHFKPKFPEGMSWGVVAGVYAESPDRVLVYQRGILPVLKGDSVAETGIPLRDNLELGANSLTTPLGKTMRREFVLTGYDRNGNMIEHWKHMDPPPGQASTAHQIVVNPYDAERHIWLVDEGEKGGLLKHTRDGKLVWRLGADSPGGCRRPQDIAFMPNGDIWCVEGFDIAKVVKFSKDGKRLFEFGTPGRGVGQLANPHALAVDKRGRLYVPDRADRIQVFDQTGKLLAVWPNIRRPTDISIDKNDVLWQVAVGRISGYDLDGRLVYAWGVPGGFPGQLYGLSQLDVDRDGNLYVAELRSGRAQMFRPKKTADRKQLIAWPLDYRQH